MSIKKLDVIGLGEVCIDWILKVDHFPEVDEKVFIRESGKFPGGVTANFVVGFSRLGGKPGFIGGLGNDQYGQYLLDVFKNEKVDTTKIKIYDNKPTAINFIVVDSKGNKIIFQDPLLKENVPDPKDIDTDIEKYIANAKALHTTAIKLETAVKAAQIAKKYGLKVSFDLEKHVVDDYGLENLKPMLALTDILMPNKLGLRTLLGKRDLVEAAYEIIEYGPKLVIITLGENGSMAITKNKAVRARAFKIKPIDTTGAGDSFNAAFIYFHVIKGLDLWESSVIANAAAALKCLKLGTQTGMPRLDELREFLSKHGYDFNI